MRTAFLSLVALASLLPAQPVVSIAGLSVMDDAIPFDELEHLPFWVGKGGTRVLLRVTSQKSMIELDHRKSTITITDGSGTDLLKAKDEKAARFSMGPFGMNNPVTKDRKTMVVGIEAPRKGTGRITCKGTLAVAVAAGIKKASAKVALKPGPVPIQGATVKIESAGKEKNWNDKEVFAVKLGFKGAAAKNFAGIRFLGNDGKAIKAERRESMSGMGMRSIKYELDVANLTSCTIELSTWDGRQVLQVPFTLQATSPL